MERVRRVPVIANISDDVLMIILAQKIAYEFILDKLEHEPNGPQSLLYASFLFIRTFYDRIYVLGLRPRNPVEQEEILQLINALEMYFEMNNHQNMQMLVNWAQGEIDIFLN
ncbi:unnamed protein product [Caenorhabditis sp. 36 PRJEB53466]|nr:unnamed protein product [Caenorhabditis sp. 36 PRJEB53466]